jgi:hypothetical protein
MGFLDDGPLPRQAGGQRPSPELRGMEDVNVRTRVAQIRDERVTEGKRVLEASEVLLLVLERDIGVPPTPTEPFTPTERLMFKGSSTYSARPPAVSMRPTQVVPDRAIPVTRMGRLTRDPDVAAFTAHIPAGFLR